MTKKGKKKSPWMQHVAKTMAEMPGVALRDVLKAASKTYKKGKDVVADALVLKQKSGRKRRHSKKRRHTKKRRRTKKRRHKKRRRTKKRRRRRRK